MDTPCHALTGFVGGLALRTEEDESNAPYDLLFSTGVSLLPDADLFLEAFGTSTYLTYHRTLNSVFILPVLLLLFIVLYRRWVPALSFRSCLVRGGILVALHVFMDLWNTFGSPILFPFSQARFALDLVFIVDPYVYLLLVVPVGARVVLGRWSPEAARWAFLGLGAYVLFCGIQHRMARAQVDRLLRSHDIERSSVIRTGVTPQPVVPGRWSVILQHRDGSEQMFLNVLTGERYAPGHHFERDGAAFELLREGAGYDRDAAVFRRFARYPVAVRMEDRIVYADLQFSMRISEFLYTYPVNSGEEEWMDRRMPFRLQALQPAQQRPSFEWIQTD